MPALISALRDPVALVRVSAIDALVKLDAAEALPHLQAILGDRKTSFYISL